MFDVTFTCVQDDMQEKQIICVVMVESFTAAVAIAESHLPDNRIPDSVECEWIPDDAELVDGAAVYRSAKVSL